MEKTCSGAVPPVFLEDMFSGSTGLNSFLGALFRSLPKNVNAGLLSVFSIESLVVTMLRLSSPLNKDADGASLASTAVLLIEDWAIVSVVLG